MPFGENLTGMYYPSKEEEGEGAEVFGAPAETSLGAGINVAFQDALHSGPVANLSFDAEYGYNQFLHHGDFLTEDQWRESDFFRKGLSFPNGVYQNVAALVAESHDGDTFRKDRLASMTPGFIAGTGKFVGSSIGFVLDPLNAASLVLAPELIGTKALPLLAEAESGAEAGLVGKAFDISSRFTIGAIEGAAILAPSELVEKASSPLTQEEKSNLSVFTTLGLGAALGGVVRVAEPFVRAFVEGRKQLPTEDVIPDIKEAAEQGVPQAEPIRPKPVGPTHVSVIDDDLDRLAKQTAVSHFMEGKRVNVSPLIQKGAYDTMTKIKADLVEKGPGALDEYNNHINAGIEDLDTQIETLNTQILDNNGKFIKPEAKEQVQAFRDFAADIDTPEAKSITKQTDRVLKDIDRASSEDLTLKQRESLNLKINNDLQNIIQDAGEVLGKSAPRELINAVQDRISLQNDLNNLLLDKNSRLAMQKMINEGVSPPTVSQIRGASDAVHSVEGDSAVIAERVTEYKEMTNALPEKLEIGERENQQRFDELIADPLLDEPQKAQLRKTKEAIADVRNSTESAIEAAIKCIVRRA